MTQLLYRSILKYLTIVLIYLFSGRLMTRQFLLPFLLGFKFHISSLIPIIFGVLALLAKKALIISKLALVIISAYGLGSLVFGYGQGGYPYNTHYSNYGQGSGPHTGHYGSSGGYHSGWK